MTDYRNREELQKAINEGYFSVNSYEKTSHKGILLEKILNMAKNDKDDIFRQLAILAEEVIQDETELSKSVDVDTFIDKAKTEEGLKSAVLDKLPITTLAIKKLDGENVESLKWLLVKKLNGSFDKRKIFDLNDSEFKKLLCSLLKGEEDKDLKDNEVDFTNKAIEDNTVEPLVESFIKYAGKSIREELEVASDDDDNNYYYLIKKQIDTLGEGKLREKIEKAHSTISFDSVEKDPIDMVDEVPEAIKGKVQLAYIKDVIKRDLSDDETEESEDDEQEVEAIDVIKDKLDIHGEGDIIIVAEKGQLDNPDAPKIETEVTEEESAALEAEFHEEEPDKEDDSDDLDTDEDEEFAEIAEADEKLDSKKMSAEEQIERQEKLTEELKQLYIIKGTKDRIMLESSLVLKDINYKKTLLARTLMYEESVGNKENKKYCEKLMKINTLVECLIRKYLPTFLE